MEFSALATISWASSFLSGAARPGGASATISLSVFRPASADSFAGAFLEADAGFLASAVAVCSGVAR